MKLPEIVTMPHPLLRKRVDEVTEFNDDLRQLAESMILVMQRAEGVGLAANQIGINARFFVYGIDEAFDLDGEVVQAITPQAVVNPVIEVVDETTTILEEGCLSIPGLNGPVARSVTVELSGQDLDGKSFSRVVHGYEARILQHETDHLNGILFLDRVTDPSKLRRSGKGVKS